MVSQLCCRHIFAPGDHSGLTNYLTRFYTHSDSKCQVQAEATHCSE